jgi:FixJ family two-component response regulator
MQASRSSAAPLVVIVEDDAALAAALRFSLELEGYDVELCSSGEALLTLELPAKEACLVIDHRLPGVHGLEALRELRRRGVDLPAVLITTNPPDELRAGARQTDASLVEKPLLGDSLVSEIRGVLADHRNR